MKRILPVLLALTTLAGCLGAQETATLKIDGPTVDEVSLSFATSDAPSSTYYEENNATHPGFFTAFDLTMQWSGSSGVPVDVGYFKEFGFFLNSIDGVGYDPDTGAFWELYVDGNASMVGMDQVEVTEGMVVAWVYGAPEAMLEEPATLTVDPPTGPVRNATYGLTGAVDRAVTLTVLLDDVVVHTGEADGAWNVTLDLPFGTSTVAVEVDGGTASGTLFNITRLADATFEVQYGGFAPGQADSSDEVWFDPDSFPATPLYAAEGLEHPPYANVHDLMEAWVEQTGSTIEYAYSETMQGFTVSKINGAGNPVSSGAPPWWCYTVDGENPGTGISLQAFEPGSTVAWVLGDCDMVGA